jgi:hypothetical protein
MGLLRIGQGQAGDDIQPGLQIHGGLLTWRTNRSHMGINAILEKLDVDAKPSILCAK